MSADYQYGYLRFEVSDVAAWSRLFTEVIGFTPGTTVGATTGFRIDRYASRVQLTQGPADDVSGVGFVASSETAYAAALTRLAEAGVLTTPGSTEDAEQRQVQRFVRFQDPDGAPLELALGQCEADTPFSSPLIKGGFDADDLGVGHVILTSSDMARTLAFYRHVFNARLSDVAKEPVMGLEPTVAFMTLNTRHHSFGFVHGAPLPKRCAHFQFEVRSVEEVGRAFDRARNAGVPIVQELGSHPDGAFSFYAATPAGIAWEVGTGTFHLDAQWQPRQLDHFSVWGHRWLMAPV